MALSATQAVVLLSLVLGQTLADKRVQVSEACVEGSCNAVPRPLKGQSILQVNSMDHSSAPVSADVVEEEEEDAEVKPRQALKREARSGEKKKKSIKGKVLLQTETNSWSKGAPVVEDTRSDSAEGEIPIPNPMAVHEEVLASSEPASVITREEKEEILKHVKRAEDIGIFDKQEVKSTRPELAEIDKMGAWAKFQGLGQLDDGQKAYEMTQDKGRISEYLKARESFDNSHNEAAKKGETRKAKANALVQMNNKKSKAQLHGEDKTHAEHQEEEEDMERFAYDIHVSEEEEKALKRTIERAKAKGAIPAPTQRSLEHIKELVRHTKILQATPIVDAKAHNMAMLQKANEARMALLQQEAQVVQEGQDDPGTPSETPSATEVHTTHGTESGLTWTSHIAEQAEAELTDEEEKATEEAAQKVRLLPPATALLHDPVGSVTTDEAGTQHMKAPHDTAYAHDFMDRIAAAADANLTAAEQEAAEKAANSNRMLPPVPSSHLEEGSGHKAAAEMATRMLQVDKSLGGKEPESGPPGHPTQRGPPR